MLVPVSARSLGAAVAGSLGLHALMVAAVLGGLSPDRFAVDADAAIAVYVESDASPVATADESAELAAAASESPPPTAPVPESEPEAVATADPPKEVPLPDFAPPPPEVLAPPEFPQPSPPPPTPAPAATRPAPPKPVPKTEPKRPAPAVASPAPASASMEQASSVPAPGLVPNASATVAPGWNALLAAWLAANRRYPDEARRRSEEGEVTVRLIVAHDGRVSEAAIVKGSGFAALDTAALRLLQGATLPAPGIEVTRTVRIRFRLGE